MDEIKFVTDKVDYEVFACVVKKVFLFGLFKFD